MHTTCDVQVGCGRDASCLAPPAQIRAGEAGEQSDPQRSEGQGPEEMRANQARARTQCRVSVAQDVGSSTAPNCRGYPRWEPYAGKLHVTMAGSDFSCPCIMGLRIFPKKMRVFAVGGNHRGNNLPTDMVGVAPGRVWRLGNSPAWIGRKDAPPTPTNPTTRGSKIMHPRLPNAPGPGGGTPGAGPTLTQIAQGGK